MTRRNVLIAGGACVALALAFAAGWAAHTTPDLHLDEQAHQEAQVREVEVFWGSQEFVTQREATTAKTEVHVVYRDPSRTVWPDGKVEEHGAVAEFTATSEQAQEVVSAALRREEGGSTTTDFSTVLDASRTVTVSTPLPDWQVAGLVGWADGRAVYGAQVDRRIIGPLHLSGAVLLGSERPIWLAGVRGPLPF